jgi:Esterase/lipase
METRTDNLSVSGHEFKVKSYWLDQVADFGKTVDYPVMIICPGGGFTFHSQREEEPIALRFNSLGMHVVVLEYKLIDDEPVFPLALQQMGKTIDWVKQQANLHHIDKSKIILTGFSAGGQVVAAYNGIGTDPKLRHTYSLEQYDDDFAAVILGYPVIDMTVKNSFPADEKVMYQISTDKTFWQTQAYLNERSKPTFIWQTRTDELVSVSNSLMYVDKMDQLGLPVEYHLFGSGIHGLALGTYVTKKPGKDKYLNAWSAEWINLAFNWLEMMGYLE